MKNKATATARALAQAARRTGNTEQARWAREQRAYDQMPTRKLADRTPPTPASRKLRHHS